MACADLRSLALPNTTITLAEEVAAGALDLSSTYALAPPEDFSTLPALCHVAGTIRPTPDSDIMFELWMPVEGWNGKFMVTGNGGAGGAIWHSSMIEPLERGYAAANTDTGHEGAPFDFSFALGHTEKFVDWGHRAVHETTVLSKAIIAAHYGSSASRAYFWGCSTGGRQGLKAAEMFPEDFDAILAGAPGNTTGSLLAYILLVRNTVTDASGALPPAKLEVLKEAAIAICDAHDGVADRVINEPGQCEFDAAVTQCTVGDGQDCLTASEVEAARRVYAGVVSPRTGEVLYPGPEPASEPGWAGAAAGAPDNDLATTYYRSVVAGDRSWDPRTFDVDRDIPLVDAASGAAVAGADLSAFAAGGGKLILYHGWTDGALSPGATIDYYDSVVRELGEQVVGSSVRLFLVPGMDHCAGGEADMILDLVTPLERWAETGEAPERLMDSRPAGATTFARSVCAYPRVSRYTGSGDFADAASWVCEAP
jgi:feruloyl esterase